MKLEYHNILLNKDKSKQSINKNIELNVDLSGNERLLPEDPIKSSVDAYEVYLNERTNCNKFRLIVNIVPYCSNVLFNPVTEVIKETNTGITVLNYSAGETVTEGVVPKTFTKNEAIRDTQITDKHVGYTYYCGIDIFNNHILRSKAYKPVNYNRVINYETGGKNVGSLMPNGTTVINSQYYSNTYLSNGGNFKFSPKEVFNTIDDFMRDRYGVPIVDMFNEIPSVDERALIPAPLHLYQKYDIMSYEESVHKNLVEENGWYGFRNKTNKSLPLLIDNGTGLSDEYYIDRVINNRNVDDFIDMYPTRDLFSFAPLYNKLKQRYEKNWNFCLTYPRYKVTGKIDETTGKAEKVPEFLTNEGGRETFALKVDRFDENTINDNGIRVVTIYSICQHGLRVGETINLYKVDGGEEVLLYNGATVVSVVDKYIFQIEKTGDDISTMWIDLNQYSENSAGKIVVNGYGQFDGEKYLLGTYKVCASLWVNVDSAVIDNLHFVKVVGGMECDYYIRKFSRVPNFKFAQEKIDLNTINDKIINAYNDPEEKLFIDFGNTTAKLGFSNSSYADGIVQTVYTDDIDVSSLKDHLGRPVSELYYTIIKNNKGYKNWYGIGTDVEPNKTTVEYSHCFGKVNSQFLLSDFYRWSKLGTVKDVRDITSADYGLDGEIEFDKRSDFYGDLCYYSPADCDEYVIQNVMARFNTVQREIELYNASTKDNFLSFKKDEIVNDEASSIATTLKGLYGVSTGYTATSDVASKGYYEGYYYQMHYKIPIKKVSSQLSYSDAIVYEIYSIENLGSYASKIRTVEANDFALNELIFIYNKETYETYTATVYEIYNSYSFAIEDKNKVLDLKEEDYDKFVIVKAHEDTPEYAKIIKDGSLRYYWREIVANGIENDSVVYPLTNGAFYINKMFNFFLRRQDPKKENLGNPSNNLGGSSGGNTFDYVPEGEYREKYTNYTTEEFYESEEIDECSFDIIKDTDAQYKLTETYQNIMTLFS